MRTPPDLETIEEQPAAEYPGWVLGIGANIEGPTPVVFDTGVQSCPGCLQDPCDCAKCVECDEPANCDYCYMQCKNCCDCPTCDACGDKVSGWSGLCDECSECEECCSCEPCAKCGEHGNTQCSGECGSCVGCCMGCTNMTKDVGWNVKPEYEDPPLDLFYEVDPPQSMADFYLYSFMETAPPAPDYGTELMASLSSVAKEAAAARERVVAQLDPIFQEYLDIAVGGELRHHPAIIGKVLSSNRSTAWGEWIDVRRKLGLQALKDAVMLFNEFDDDGGFGGLPWATAAQVLHDRQAGTIPPWLFVDRVFTLQHHNGCILNKVAWALNGRVLGSVENCLIVGEAHSDADIDFNTLVLYASKDAVSLFRRWWAIRNRILTAKNQRPVPFPTWVEKLERRRTYYSSYPQWEYVNTRSGRRISINQDAMPHLAALASELPLDDVEEEYRPRRRRPAFKPVFVPSWDPPVDDFVPAGYSWTDSQMKNSPGWQNPEDWSGQGYEYCNCLNCSAVKYKEQVAQENQAKKEAELAIIEQDLTMENAKYQAIMAQVYGPFDGEEDDDDLF